MEGLSRSFERTGAGTVYALRDFDLDIQRGETLALLGPSGCGKTTTLKLLNRLMEPTAGRIFVGGQDTSKIDVVRLRRRMGYVVQNGGLFPHLTVSRNLSLLCELEGWTKQRASSRVDQLLELVRLPPSEFRNRYPRELSGGQSQRVGVARALALDPEILLMDEPFGALDPITRAHVQQEFRDLKRRVSKTIVIVTHDLREASVLGDRIALLNEGRLIQVGTPAELHDEPATPWVRAFFANNGSES